MPKSDSRGEGDSFLDVDDEIRNSTQASPSDGCSTSEISAILGPHEYELWAGGLMSVEERRHRFLNGMGFVEPIPTGIDCARWQGETTADCSIREPNERINSICSSFRSCFSNDVSPPDSAYCIKDLDNRKRFIVQEDQHDGLTGILQEVGSDKMMTSNESKCLFGFSHVIHKFLWGSYGLTSARGTNQARSAKQKYFKSLWKSITRMKGQTRSCMHDGNVKNLKTSTLSRTKVHLQNKKWMDFSAIYVCQEIQAHKGLIKVMKFSPSGRYLASGGEDSVVRIWLISEVESSPNLYGREMHPECMNRKKGLKEKLGKGRSRALAIIPKKVFSIAETPMNEFHGHGSDILDMTWSNSDFLLTSSKDKTVRMWKVGCDGCLAVFEHRDYVTCIQFNPVDERYFISCSIDGKVRVWDVSEKRVVDWADARDVISALSYQPDGKGFVVGTVTGTCRFYHQSGQNIQLSKLMQVKQKKNSAANQITSLQISRGDPSQIIIASADSKIRVSEDVEVIQKFEGPRNSKVLLSPSLTSDGRYLIAAGTNSNVHIWNFDTLGSKSTKGPKLVCSCEMFFSEGVTVVAPWAGLSEGSNICSSPSDKTVQTPTLCHDQKHCSFGTWIFPDGTRGSATWPEEKLLPSLKYVNCTATGDCGSKVSAAWNKVIVTGSHDGLIRSFHNYGLPVRLYNPQDQALDCLTFSCKPAKCLRNFC